MDNALTDLKQGHTPGPWKAERMGTDQLHIIAPKNGSVVAALKRHPVTRDFVEANARLIAASPVLLKALQDLVAAVETGPWVKEQQAPLDAALNAIARATGAA